MDIALNQHACMYVIKTRRAGARYRRMARLTSVTFVVTGRPSKNANLQSSQMSATLSATFLPVGDNIYLKNSLKSTQLVLLK